jgi:hypothetical protein
MINAQTVAAHINFENMDKFVWQLTAVTVIRSVSIVAEVIDATISYRGSSRIARIALVDINTSATSDKTESFVTDALSGTVPNRLILRAMRIWAADWTFFAETIFLACV